MQCAVLFLYLNIYSEDVIVYLGLQPGCLQYHTLKLNAVKDLFKIIFNQIKGWLLDKFSFLSIVGQCKVVYMWSGAQEGFMLQYGY